MCFALCLFAGRCGAVRSLISRNMLGSREVPRFAEFVLYLLDCVLDIPSRRLTNTVGNMRRCLTARDDPDPEEVVRSSCFA